MPDEKPSCHKWEIPLRTISEANCSEHWTKKARRHKQQQQIIKLVMRKEIGKVKLPCLITLTRISPRSLDYDNLVSSQKWVLDAICGLLVPGLRPGRADDDKRITTQYKQEKGQNFGIRIEIETNGRATLATKQ